jgi:Ca-activated chloride channel family protein
MRLRRVLSSLACLALPSGARACDLALLLALDISGSVDPHEYQIQRDGLAMALRDGLVARALVQSEAQVAVMQWTGSTRQRVTIDWTALKSIADVERFAGRVAMDTRAWRNFSTAIGEAMQAGQVELSKVDCKRKVIDISGDGKSNEGILPSSVKAKLQSAGIVVNALVIGGLDDNLTDYFQRNVITGAGSFAMTANSFKDYPARIQQKLIREIVPQTSRFDETQSRHVRFVITR